MLMKGGQRGLSSEVDAGMQRWVDGRRGSGRNSAVSRSFPGFWHSVARERSGRALQWADPGSPVPHRTMAPGFCHRTRLMLQSLWARPAITVRLDRLKKVPDQPTEREQARENDHT